MQQLEWKIGETNETDRPADLEMGIMKIKVRRNIARETRTTDEGTRKVWTYEYADMTPTQYETYKDELAQLDTPFAKMITESNAAQLETLAEIYEAQTAQVENQESIMEGLADLYDAQGVE